MEKIRYEIEYVYGSGSGTTSIICHIEDDIETIKAKVRRQEGLNYLSMATYRIKIIDSTPLQY